MPNGYCCGFYAFFLSFKERVNKSFPELFTQRDRNEPNFGTVENFAERWGWYQSIFALSRGDIERFEHISKLNVFKCLTMLTFMKEKNDIEISQIKKNKI